MKDYSKFINGFITNYEIKDNEILIHTPLTKKNEPIRRPYTKENIKKYEARIENQYNMIIENQEEIIKFNNKRMSKYLAVWGIISSILTTSSFILLGATLIPRLIFAFCLASVFTGSCIIEIKENNFRNELKQYVKYMKNRQNIEELAKKDENVTAYLNQESLSLIEENEKLKQEGIIDSVYNIDLMDKMELKELRKLLLSYHISESIEIEQQFRIPEEISKCKTKKLSKEEPLQ